MGSAKESPPDKSVRSSRISKRGRKERGRWRIFGRRAEMREERDFTKLDADWNHMSCLLCGSGLLKNNNGDLSRRADRAPGRCRACLAVRTSPAALFQESGFSAGYSVLT